MHRRRSMRTEEEHENHERWLITYADMITLLLALFMMLYAMSVLDLRKFEAFQQSFKTGMGKHVHALPGDGDPQDGQLSSQKPGDPKVKPSNVAASAVGTPGSTEADVGREYLKKVATELNQKFQQNGQIDQVAVALEHRGLVVTVKDGALFASGDAAIRAAGVKILRTLGPVITKINNPLTVEGHTDNVPITGTYPSNWELSTARATSVLHWLIDNFQIRPSRLSAIGYGDTRPLFPNNTAEHRAKNRRVEVVINAPE